MNGWPMAGGNAGRRNFRAFETGSGIGDRTPLGRHERRRVPGGSSRPLDREAGRRLLSDGDTLVSVGAGKTVGIDPETGSVEWRRFFRDATVQAGTETDTHPYSPAIDRNGTLYVSYDGDLLSFDVASGERAASTIELEPASESGFRPVGTAIAGGGLYTSHASEEGFYLNAVETATGEVSVLHEPNGNGIRGVPQRAVVGSEWVCIPVRPHNRWGRPGLLTVDRRRSIGGIDEIPEYDLSEGPVGPAGAGAAYWKLSAGDYPRNVAIDGGSVYLVRWPDRDAPRPGGGPLLERRLLGDGMRVKWQVQLPAAVHALAVGRDHVFLAHSDRVSVVATDKSSRAVYGAETSTEDRSILATGGSAFSLDGTHVTELRTRAGGGVERVDRRPFGGRRTTDPAVVGGKLVVETAPDGQGDRTRELVGFDIGEPSPRSPAGRTPPTRDADPIGTPQVYDGVDGRDPYRDVPEAFGFDAFEFREEIASGPFTRTLRAHSTVPLPESVEASGDIVAVTVPRVEEAGSRGDPIDLGNGAGFTLPDLDIHPARFIERFRAGAEEWRRATGYGFVVPYLDHGVHDGVPWVAAEHQAGGTVDENRGSLDRSGKLTVLMRVGKALYETNQSDSLNHGSVAEHNVHLGEAGKPQSARLGGWGQDFWEHWDGDEPAGHVAPQQFSGVRTPQTDSYGLAALAFRLFTGERYRSPDTASPDAVEDRLAAAGLDQRRRQLLRDALRERDQLNLDRLLQRLSAYQDEIEG